MSSFNKVILMGNLTRDPELRYTPSGTAVAKLSLAVNRSWRSDSGETREEVTFVEVDSFGKQAETVGQYLKKGRPLLVEGRLKMDQWEDKQTGKKRSRLGVVLEGFRFIGAGPAQGSNQPRQTAPAPSQPQAPQPTEDDVPF
jgi:single-strand DNA-binding protein